MHRFALKVCLLCGLCWLVACGSETPVVTLPPTPTSSAEIAQSATATPQPTATTAPPTATPTLAPTSTPEPGVTVTPTPLPTNTPPPTATPTLVALGSQAEIDAVQRSRLTGELIEDETILNRRPIICKVSNSPAKYTRPQSGLGSADLVFEHLSEGVTRFSALFYSKTPELIGPIRSARLIDTYLAPMYDAALCFSGASIGVSERLESSPFRGRLVRSYYDGYQRINRDDVPSEHTFFANPAPFWDQLDEFELNQAPESETQMVFSEASPEGGESAEIARIQYKDWSLVEWMWDAELDKWTRTVDGELATDATTGELISAENVLFLFVPHYVDETICDWQLELVPERTPDCIAGGLYPDFADDGDLFLMRDGQKFAGRWDSDGENMPTFVDMNGDPLPLQIGNSWFQILPYSYENSERVGFE